MVTDQILLKNVNFVLSAAGNCVINCWRQPPTGSDYQMIEPCVKSLFGAYPCGLALVNIILTPTRFDKSVSKETQTQMGELISRTETIVRAVAQIIPGQGWIAELIRAFVWSTTLLGKRKDVTPVRLFSKLEDAAPWILKVIPKDPPAPNWDEETIKTALQRAAAQFLPDGLQP